MKPLLSPFIKQEIEEDYPLLDDPYAYITRIDRPQSILYENIQRRIDNHWITERDIEIIHFLYVHRWVLRHQIHRLFFSGLSKHRSNERLKKLRKIGMVSLIEWNSYARKTNKPAIYEIGAQGADILTYEYGIRLGSRHPRKRREHSLSHRFKYVSINELYIQLLEHFQVKRFEFHPVLQIIDETQVPMAKMVLATPNRDIMFYLLNIREEENWMKTLRYQAYFYKRYRKEEEFILIVQVSTEERAKKAKDILEQEGMEDNWFMKDDDLENRNKKLTQSFFTFNNGTLTYYDLE